MDKRLAALILLPAALLSGCASMLRRTYTSSGAHVEYAQTEDPSVLRAETYRGLVDAILYIVNDHAAQGVVRLYNYTGDVDADLKAACDEVLREDPLTAFSVSDISYECARIVSYYETTFTLTYSHSAQEVDAIRYAAGAANLRQELTAAMAAFSPSLILRLSYFPGDADTVRDMALQVWYETPQAALALPEFQISVYPERGVQRIVEVELRWPEPPEVLSRRSEDMMVLAEELLAANPPAQEGQERLTPTELALLLRQTAAPMDPGGARDPYSALSGQSADQLGHTLALELLCRLSQVETVFVSGSAGEGDAWWLAVNTEDGWRHLPLTEEEPRLYTDRELTEMGYTWDGESCPPCVGESAPDGREVPDPNPSDAQT